MSLNRKRKNASSGFVLFNIVYEDGALSSNRKVPTTAFDELELNGGNRNAAAKAFLEQQDREMAQTNGVHRGPIKSLTPSDR